MTIVYFIIALGILIFVHELGHFIMAKRAGIFVETFSLGFGPRLVGFKCGDTDYRISLLPFGGYVNMRGEEPADEKAGDPQSFAVKSVWARVKVIVWGPLMNLILCLVFMPIVFMIGRQEPVFLREAPVLMDVRAGSPAADAGLMKGDTVVALDGKEISTWEDVLNRVLLEPNANIKFDLKRNGELIEKEIKVSGMPEMRGGYIGIEPMLFYGNEAVVGGVSASGAAAKAGIKGGDKVISFAGKEIKDWVGLSETIGRSGASEQNIVIERGGEKLSLRVQPEFNKDFGRYVIGIMQDTKNGVPMVIRKLSFADAIVAGTKENIKLARLTFDVLKKLVTLKLSYKVLGGPIIIAKVSAAAAASGLSDFIYFLAFLSLQLGILNLMPVPVLDGGFLVFLGIEAIIRRPLSVKIRNIATQVGFVALISFMLLVTYNDIDKVWGIREIINKIF